MTESVGRFRFLLAEQQAIVSPVAGEKPDDSGCEHPSPPVFSPADVLEARRFCLLLVAGMLEADDENCRAIQEGKIFCVHLRDLRFLMGGRVAL